MSKSKIVLATALLTLTLAGCGDKGGAPTGQVVAKVGDEEITTSQLEAETKIARGMPREAVVQSLIARTLIAQEADKQGLGDTPEGALIKHKAEQLALIELLRQKLQGGVPKASADEINQFIAANPQMFSERKIYIVDQIVVPKGDPALAKLLEPTKTLEEVTAVLTQRGVPFNKAVGSLDMLAVGPQVSKQIAALPAGEIFVVPEGVGGFRANRVRDTSTAPITGENARLIATDMMGAQRTSAQVDAKLGEIVKVGQTKVTINEAFKPKQAPAPEKK